MDEKKVVQSLKEVKEVFDKLNIRFWLDSGTLLGAVRNGKLIEWDNDVDLGTTEDNSNKIIHAAKELDKRGFDVLLVHSKIGEDIPDIIVRFWRNGFPINVRLYKIGKKNAIKISAKSTNLISKGLRAFYFGANLQDTLPELGCESFVVKLIKQILKHFPINLRRYLADIAQQAWWKSYIELIHISIPKHYFVNLKTINFYGMTFNIPSNVKSYLTYRYGKDWKKCKKEWEWEKDDGSVKPL